MEKKNFFSFIAFMLFAISSVLVSCSAGYDADLEEILEELPSDDQKPEEKDGDWGTVLEKTYTNVGEEWPSTIKLQKADGNIVEFKVNLPMEASLGADEYTTTETSDASSFVEILAADTVCTAWQADGKGNFIRKVTYTRRILFSKFDRTLTASWWEAYRIINGKQESYLVGRVANPFISNHESSNSEIVIDDKKYDRETNNVTLTFVYHKNDYELNATTYVDRFLDVLENGENKDPENQEPSEEQMPDAQVYIEDDVQFLYWTKVFDVNSNVWRNALLFKSNTHYYPVVDGTLYKIDASTIAKSDKYNGAVFAQGSYLPAVITVDGDGWTTVGQYADGTPIIQTHDMQNSEIQGIKNFSQTDHAKVTPFVKVSVDEKNYNGKEYFTVNGIDVNGKVFASYTVAEK